MGNPRFLLLGISFLLFASTATVATAPSSAGFLYIDCGKPENYTYEDTYGLTYISDFSFIDTGDISDVASSYANLGYLPKAEDVRSFPNGTRNCYTLKPIDQGTKYLVRTEFLYGNYDGLEKTPTFDLYLGVQYWVKISVSNASGYFYREILTVAASDSISVCLVNIGKGTPFISALEVRPLPGDFYDQVVNQSQALDVLFREAYGGASETIRYPKDAFDRYWRQVILPEWTTINCSCSILTSSFQPPSKVMSTASTPASASLSMNFSLAFNKVTDQRISKPVPFIAMHFAELQLLNSSSRIFDIYVNDKIWSPNVTLLYLKASTRSGFLSPWNFDRISVSLIGKEPSILPPAINAIEVYRVLDFSAMETDANDVAAIKGIKLSFDIKRNWMGDPCAPEEFVWEGLNCTYANGSSPRIISLNLSSSGLTGEIPASLVNLIQLQYLDLSNNTLNGAIPDFLANLPLLKFLDLTGNNLTESIPADLQAKANNGTLTLRVDQTSISDSEPKKRRPSTIVIVAVVCSAFLLLALTLLFCYFRSSRTNVHSDRQKKMDSGSNQESAIGGKGFQEETRQFSFNDLEKMTGNFATVIGKGGFGFVYHGTLENGQEVAIKLLSRESSQGINQFENEVLLLRNVNHRNLVSLIGYCKEQDKLALVYEYMDEGSLYDHLLGKSMPFSWKECLKIAVAAAQGLEYLHNGCKLSIIHRDVKPQNILLNRKMETKIADFGLSRIYESDIQAYVSTVVMGTPGYLDPEYATAQKLTKKSDIYSFGIVLLQLVTGLPAILNREGKTCHVIDWVRGYYERGAIEQIVDKRFREKYEINSIWRMMEVAFSCASPDSSERPTMREVLIQLNECLELEQSNATASTATSSQMLSPAMSIGITSGLLPK